jgi:hypothetical protein
MNNELTKWLIMIIRTLPKRDMTGHKIQITVSIDGRTDSVSPIYEGSEVYKE